MVGGDGTVYIADSGNHAIRTFGTNGLRTLAGYPAGTNNTVPEAGSVDGPAGQARFNSPHAIIMGADGNLLVADTMNHAIRQVAPDGTVITFAGTLNQGGVRDGSTFLMPSSGRPVAQFWTPDILALGTNGLIFVGDTFGRRWCKIDTNGIVTTLAGFLNVPAFLLPAYVAGNSPALPSQILADYVCGVAAGDPLTADSQGQLEDISLALIAGGTPAYWGDDDYQQGNWPSGLDLVAALAAGATHCLALHTDGTAVGWKEEVYGEDDVPSGRSDFVGIAAGNKYSLAWRADGTAVNWGRGADEGWPSLSALTDVVRISAFEFNTLLLHADGTLSAWASNTNDYGVLNLLSPFVGVAAGGNSATVCFSLGLRADGTVAAWGDNSYGQTNVPSGLAGVVAIAAGMNHCLALRSNGTVVAWGGDSSGQRDVPPGLDHVVAVAAGAVHSMALKDDGTVVQWGFPAGSYQPSIPVQSSDTAATNAVFQRPTAGVLTPDGRVLVADQFGLRLFDYSDRWQRQAATYLENDLTTSVGPLNTAGNTLTAWCRLLQTLAIYALNDAPSTNDAPHSLLFGSDSLIDADAAATFLDSLANKADWRPTHTDLGAVALQRLGVLRSSLISTVTQMAQTPNPVSLPLVTDTLNRLKLLLATHDPQVPQPAIGFSPGTNNTLSVLLNGCPYFHYALESSSDLRLQTWTSGGDVLRDGSTTNITTSAVENSFYRAAQQTP